MRRWWHTIAGVRRLSFWVGYVSALCGVANVILGSKLFGVLASLTTAASLAAFSRLESLRDREASPRGLSQAQRKRIVEKLRRAPRGLAEVHATFTSEEAVTFGAELLNVFMEAGWTLTHNDVIRGWFGNRDKPGLEVDINIRNPEHPGAIALVQALQAEGLVTNASFLKTEPPGTGADVLVNVGSKPRPDS
jgi:hypothetical protein